MRLIRELALAAAIASAPIASAVAVSEPDQDRLAALLAQAEDISAGKTVGGAKFIAWNGRMLTGDDACMFSILVNADAVCTTEAIVFPPEDVAIDSIYYAPAEEIGHVNMDDWTEDATQQIDQIWANYVEGTKEQSARIGFEVVPLRWVLYPALNKSARVMTYGILLSFGGEEVINLTTVKFTRTGYVEMTLVTDHQLLGSRGAAFDEIALYAAKTYLPVKGMRYADFQDGDRIAGIGALGVLAAVVGTKHSNKGTFAAIGAAIMAFAKKLWFLLLIIPAAIWGAVKKLVGRDDEAA